MSRRIRNLFKAWSSNSSRRRIKRPSTISSLRLETLEGRSMLATCAPFANGDLLLTDDGTNQIEVAANGLGQVTVNGNLQLCGGFTVNAANVDYISVDGQGGADEIDLSGVTSVKFTNGALTTVVAGGDGDDTIFGSMFPDYLSGDNHLDSIIGGAGNDTLLGAAGDDELEGGAGNDLLDGGSDNNSFIFSGFTNLGTDSISPSDSNSIDTLDFSSFVAYINLDLAVTGNQLLYPSVLTLNLSSSTAIENVISTGSGANLLGNSNDNIFTFSNASQAVVFEGRGGNDTYSGIASSAYFTFQGASGLVLGDDIIDVAADILEFDFQNYAAAITLDLSTTGTFQDVATDGSATDMLSLRLDQTASFVNGVYGYNDTGVYGYSDSLTGSSIFDYLLGNGGNDSLSGGDGSDILKGSAGDDSLDGGDDADQYIYDEGGALFNHGWDTITNTDGDDEVSFVGVGQGATFRMDVWYGQTVMNNGTGNLLVITLTYGTKVRKVVGSGFGDSVHGSSEGDTIIGGGGVDWLFGLAGNDLVEGGNDGDYLWGSGGNDTLRGGDGDDLFDDNTGYQLGDDEYEGGNGNDTISSGEGNDLLNGGAGNDLYKFDSGNTRNLATDTITDASGSDTLEFSYHNLAVSVNLGTTGNQTVSTGLTLNLNSATSIENVVGSQYGDSITGNSLANNLNGNNGNDTINGGAGNDTLDGFWGDDVIHGGTGNDTLYGGEGGDVLRGEDDNDYLEGGNLSDTLNGGSGTDTQKGGSGIDALEDVIENYVA